MRFWDKIDLHMHTDVSDGTDKPSEIVRCVKAAGITLFSVTDHDAVRACAEISGVLKEGDPAFITGVEFSCKDEKGKYHILGYGYDIAAKSILGAVEDGHNLRVAKLKKRLDFIERQFGFSFSQEDKERLFSLSNPGKPHIGNLMVEYGYAPSMQYAIERYINECGGEEAYIRPERAIDAILGAGGIPVLAHPSYGRGDELIIGDDMDKRLKRLISFGLRGVEAYYSGFTPPLIKEMLAFAEKYDLMITAGSDYHGGNKLVPLGDTNLSEKEEYPKGLTEFLSEVRIYNPNK